jgi:hypothetical protein
MGAVLLGLEATMVRRKYHGRRAGRGKNRRRPSS